jgi:hypothetical protein
MFGKCEVPDTGCSAWFGPPASGQDQAMIGAALGILVLGIVLLFIIPWVGIPLGIIGLVLVGLYLVGLGRRPSPDRYR